VNPVVRQSRELYRLVIKFYPHSLQREFAAEMLDVFGEQMADAWAEKGVLGFVRVWGSVIAEVLQGPASLSLLRPVLIVPAVSLFGSSALFILFFWGMGFLAKNCR